MNSYQSRYQNLTSNPENTPVTCLLTLRMLSYKNSGYGFSGSAGTVSGGS